MKLKSAYQDDTQTNTIDGDPAQDEGHTLEADDSSSVYQAGYFQDNDQDDQGVYASSTFVARDEWPHPEAPSVESLDRRYEASDKSWIQGWLQDEVDPCSPE